MVLYRGKVNEGEQSYGYKEEGVVGGALLSCKCATVKLPSVIDVDWNVEVKRTSAKYTWLLVFLIC